MQPTASQKTITNLTSTIASLVEAARDPGEPSQNITSHVTAAMYVLAHVAEWVGGEDGGCSDQFDKGHLGAMLDHAIKHLERARKLIASAA